ncbi:hypothetical protein TNCT_18881 [Trichonephila clavata]|uniref:Uncharacterized protein n=1 Tax=Trichonephila clavata TaxID=2740835 RepID=A0A8X6L220_TRICU|nr:hypothetical protein TNCT_18881 [Trichonephila clavata]
MLAKYCSVHEDFTLLRWPRQSSDLTPIEHLSDEVENAIRHLNGINSDSGGTRGGTEFQHLEKMEFRNLSFRFLE